MMKSTMGHGSAFSNEHQPYRIVSLENHLKKKEGANHCIMLNYKHIISNDVQRKLRNKTDNQDTHDHKTIHDNDLTNIKE